jgi:hypothetical protein
MLEGRWKVAQFNKCKACPYARWMPNIDFVLNKSNLGENRSRIYVGCGGLADHRGFDADMNIYGPETIPEWCPLSDAPKD